MSSRRTPDSEDWAETFAHYLHIRDTLDTSATFGFTASGATFERRMLGPSKHSGAQPYGAALLIAADLGIITYGLYSFAMARYTKM